MKLIKSTQHNICHSERNLTVSGSMKSISTLRLLRKSNGFDGVNDKYSVLFKVFLSFFVFLGELQLICDCTRFLSIGFLA